MPTLGIPLNFITAPSMPVVIASTVLSTEAQHEHFIPTVFFGIFVVCLIASMLIAVDLCAASERNDKMNAKRTPGDLTRLLREHGLI